MRTNRRTVLAGLTSCFAMPLFAKPAHGECLLTTREGIGTRQPLLQVLGLMPDRPKRRFEVLEQIRLPGGERFKIEYLSEKADALFREPQDLIRAYLFVPDHPAGAKLPAVLAIHQDGPQSHLGKLETAGLAGDRNLHYGLELFERGYVVLCPDRFGHAERRRGVAQDSVDPQRDDDLLNHRVGQLLLKGRTMMGKEAFDCVVGADVLASLSYVDPSRIGGLGHSAGGLALVYWMFLDRRVKVGVSSCGYFDLLRFFQEDAPKRRMAALALPHLAQLGRSTDYLAGIAPRPLMLTRGLHEWGQDGEDDIHSRAHVQETKDLVRTAIVAYRQRGKEENLQAVYFDEAEASTIFHSTSGSMPIPGLVSTSQECRCSRLLRNGTRASRQVETPAGSSVTKLAVTSIDKRASHQ